VFPAGDSIRVPSEYMSHAPQPDVTCTVHTASVKLRNCWDDQGINERRDMYLLYPAPPAISYSLGTG
jgi:hypothetical protein